MPPSPKKLTKPLSFRLPESDVDELNDAAEHLHVPPSMLVRVAVRAALDAIERTGGRIILPLKLDLNTEDLRTAIVREEGDVAPYLRDKRKGGDSEG